MKKNSWIIFISHKNKGMQCPYCLSEINDKARKCRYCWERVVEIDNPFRDDKNKGNSTKNSKNSEDNDSTIEDYNPENSHSSLFSWNSVDSAIKGGKNTKSVIKTHVFDDDDDDFEDDFENEWNTLKSESDEDDLWYEDDFDDVNDNDDDIQDEEVDIESWESFDWETDLQDEDFDIDDEEDLDESSSSEISSNFKSILLLIVFILIILWLWFLILSLSYKNPWGDVLEKSNTSTTVTKNTVTDVATSNSNGSDLISSANHRNKKVDNISVNNTNNDVVKLPTNEVEAPEKKSESSNVDISKSDTSQQNINQEKKATKPSCSSYPGTYYRSEDWRCACPWDPVWVSSWNKSTRSCSKTSTNSQNNNNYINCNDPTIQMSCAWWWDLCPKDCYNKISQSTRNEINDAINNEVNNTFTYYDCNDPVVLLACSMWSESCPSYCNH